MELLNFLSLQNSQESVKMEKKKKDVPTYALP